MELLLRHKIQILRILGKAIQCENSHQGGGYADFAQDPPVFLQEEYDQYEVLLTMGYGYYINWGDAGTANFLIKKEDLAKLDFTKTVYEWSCG